MKAGEDMSFVDILDSAMYKKARLSITTKTRGIISGVPAYLDDFISDSERLGYCLDISESEADTVFIDEIESIKLQNEDML